LIIFTNHHHHMNWLATRGLNFLGHHICQPRNISLGTIIIILNA
jgi:hypothetical protein